MRREFARRSHAVPLRTMVVAAFTLLMAGYAAIAARGAAAPALARSGVRRAVPACAHSTIAMAMMKRGRGPPPPEHMINDFIKANEVRVMAEATEPELPDVALGVMSREEALRRAREEGIDLVCVSPGADPPVCKLIDYGRFRFQLDKKKKVAKKAAHTSEMKELKMSYTIETHDFNVRVRAAQKFLASGDKVGRPPRARARTGALKPRRAGVAARARAARARAPRTRAQPAVASPLAAPARTARPRPQVKAVVQFKGREMQHTDIGTEMLKRLADDLADFGSTDGPPKMSGNRMEVYITPKPRK